MKMATKFILVGHDKWVNKRAIVKIEKEEVEEDGTTTYRYNAVLVNNESVVLYETIFIFESLDFEKEWGLES